MPNKFNPLNRDDTKSRKTWTENVTQRDKAAERQRLYQKLVNRFPDYTEKAIMRIMRSL